MYILLLSYTFPSEECAWTPSMFSSNRNTVVEEAIKLFLKRAEDGEPEARCEVQELLKEDVLYEYDDENELFYFEIMHKSQSLTDAIEVCREELRNPTLTEKLQKYLENMEATTLIPSHNPNC